MRLLNNLVQWTTSRHRSLLYGLLSLMLVLGLGTLGPLGAASPILFEDTFDSGQFQPYNGGAGWNQTQFTEKSLGTIVSSPTRAGAGAAQFNVVHPDTRAEKNKFAAGRPGSERWFGFSIYIPPNWQDHGNFTVVNQITGVPDQGEPHRSPLLPLEIRNGVWQLYNRWDANKISQPASNGNGGTIRSSKLYEGAYAKGEWTDWVVHAKWSYRNDGILEVWKNGVKVVTKRGPNCYNDPGFHFKIGIYKPGYSTSDPSPIVIYHDEVRIGNEYARYADVAPPAAVPTTNTSAS